MPPRNKGGNDDEEKESSDDKNLIPYSKQLPTLNQDNYVEFQEALINVIYYAKWHADTLDLRFNIADPWDGTEENDKKRQKARKLAFVILCLKLSPSLHHLKTGIRPGDARGLWKKIHNRFFANNSGSYQRLENEAQNLSMQNTNLTVELYASRLQQKYKQLLEINGEDYNEKAQRAMTNIFINGCFDPSSPSLSLLCICCLSINLSSTKFIQAYTTSPSTTRS